MISLRLKAERSISLIYISHLRVVSTIKYSLLPWQPQNIYYMYKLKDGSRRLDQDITGTKKPLVITGALKPVIPCPNIEGVKDSNVGVSKVALLQN